MTHYAELTFQSYYGELPIARSTLVLNGKTKEVLSQRVLEALGERIDHTPGNKTLLEKQNYYER